MKKGVEDPRLSSQGYGPNQPLETNATPEVLVPCVPEPSRHPGLLR